MRYPNFSTAIGILRDRMRTAPIVHTERWQGTDISKKPEMATHELMNVFFTVPVGTTESDVLAQDVGPNLPWADMHFAERVSGQPLNPPPSWKAWPWGHSAGNFLDARGQFNHTYPERFWPRWAGQTVGGKLAPDGTVTEDIALAPVGTGFREENPGIRYRLGDLSDVLDLLEREPLTRQAYLPVWFPEDTGAAHKDRTPCTLGYHFLMRRDKLHCFYYIRSCEFVRHFRDDIYLGVRLQLWVLEKLTQRNVSWVGVQPGDFAMHIGSLHMFRNDWLQEFKP